MRGAVASCMGSGTCRVVGMGKGTSTGRGAAKVGLVSVLVVVVVGPM